MIYTLTWLPAVLESSGLKVAPVDGWESRGRAQMGDVLGVMCHHTAGPKTGNMPSLDTLITGRSDLAGPLAHLGLGRDGTFYVIAAGRCNHAGTGSWLGINTGNTNFIGIEAENTGLANDTPWPAVQLDSYKRGVAALLTHAGRTVEFCVGHKEFALPAGRKSDPDFDMKAFRVDVAAFMSVTAPVPNLIPAQEPEPAGQPPGRPTVRRSLTAPANLVNIIQTKLKISATGLFDGETESKVRDFQSDHDLVPDGIVGPKTWAALDAA